MPNRMLHSLRKTMTLLVGGAVCVALLFFLVARNTGTADAPAIGNINGIKVSIPKNYLFGWVQYEGQEPLDPFPVSTPTFDSKILHFAMLLRLSNFQPITTPQDKADYDESMSRVFPDYKEMWLGVGFHLDTYNPKDGLLKHVVTNWEKDGAERGPYIKQKSPVDGLVYENSVRPAETKIPRSPHYAFFYDETTYKTFIHCQSHTQYVPPYATFTDCHHLFVVPEFKIVAEAIYTKKDLPRWREIEEETKKIIHSFIVQ